MPSWEALQPIPTKGGFEGQIIRYTEIHPCHLTRNDTHTHAEVLAMFDKAIEELDDDA